MKCVLCFNIKSTPRLAKNTNVVVAESGADRLVKIFEQCDVPWRDSKWRDSMTCFTWFRNLHLDAFSVGELAVLWMEKTCRFLTNDFLADFLFEFDASTGLSSVNSVELCGKAGKSFVHTS